MKETDIAAMKKATNLNVSVQNQVGTVVTFQVPMAGFARAFDGAPVDPQQLEAAKKQMQEQLQKQGQEELSRRGGGAAQAPPAKQ
jgi:hypothetical protein